MRKISAFLLSFIFIFTFFNVDAYGAQPEGLASGAAVLMDAATGQVLYNKDMNRRVYPASTTKILTALLVLEHSKPYEIMTVSETALEGISWDSAHIALTPGEQLTVEEGLYALMLPSANDAANVLAEHVAGSTAAFAEMMNERARQIGALDSHFTNPHGLHDADHYTTAYDLALITRYAMKNADFMVYFGTPRYTMKATNKNTERYFTNLQYMLIKETGFYTPEVIGGKVGFTGQAKNTMSTIARRGDRTLIATVMSCETRDEKFTDTELLLDFGFEEFVSFSLPASEFGDHSVSIMEEGKRIGQALFTAKGDFTALLHSSVDPSSVTVSYTTPEAFMRGDSFVCDASFFASGGPSFVPSALGAVSMDPEVIIPTVYAAGVPDSSSGAKSESLFIRILKAAGIVVLILIALLTLLVLYQRHRIKKQRLLRRRRIERLRGNAAVYPMPARNPPAARTPARAPGKHNVYDYPSRASGRKSAE
jgi:D-alanyl-D-alanine carboxypeptidase